MENHQIRKAQLRQRDVEREIKGILKGIEIREKELEDLRFTLNDLNNTLLEITRSLEGKKYIGNT